MKVGKGTYALVILLCIFKFTGPILDFMNVRTEAWAEAQKNTITNGEIVFYFSLMFLGSVLLAALIGVAICIPIKLLFGKKSKEAAEQAQFQQIKKPKMLTHRSRPTKKQVLGRVVALVGLSLAIVSFLLCTGIEHAATIMEILFGQQMSEDMHTDLMMAVLDAEGLGVISSAFKWIMALQQENLASFLLSFAPGKITVIGLLAIAVSVLELECYGGTRKMNIVAIVIAVLSLVLNYFFSPWIQLFGAIFYHTFGTGFVDWFTSMYEIFCHFKDFIVEIYETLTAEGFMEQKYIDTIH